MEKDKLLFKTFTEFCERCDEILKEFEKRVEKNKLDKKIYKQYIYNNHNFSDNKLRDMQAKDKCWMWLMSYKYEKMNKEDLLKTKEKLKKGY